MTKESKRTQGKLSYKQDMVCPAFYDILNEDGTVIARIKPISDLPPIANAKFMVKAWNNHDGLVEALESVAKYLHTQDSIEAECALMEAQTVLNKVEGKE